MHLTHLGGENTVTGSCHLLQANGLNILMDFGLAQGGDRVADVSSWPVAPGEIDFLFVTHVHISHIGRIPELIRHGFKGEILCSHPTMETIPKKIPNSMKYLFCWIDILANKKTPDAHLARKSRLVEKVKRSVLPFVKG